MGPGPLLHGSLELGVAQTPVLGRDLVVVKDGSVPEGPDCAGGLVPGSHSPGPGPQLLGPLRVV